MPMDTIILKHIFYSAILFAENLYELRLGKLLEKLYIIFWEKVTRKICVY